MFFARSASLLARPKSLSASTVIEVSGTGCTRVARRASRPPAGWPRSRPSCRLRLVNSSVLTMIVARRAAGRARFAFSAAGFIATSTFGASPGVRMSWSAKCSWNDETPGRVPAGARISAGKFGSVDRSLPNAAVS